MPATSSIGHGINRLKWNCNNCARPSAWRGSVVPRRPTSSHFCGTILCHRSLGKHMKVEINRMTQIGPLKSYPVPLRKLSNCSIFRHSLALGFKFNKEKVSTKVEPPGKRFSAREMPRFRCIPEHYTWIRKGLGTGFSSNITCFNDKSQKEGFRCWAQVLGSILSKGKDHQSQQKR